MFAGAQGATALRAEGGGGGSAANLKKGRGFRRGLCRRVMFAGAQGATALRAEGGGLPLCGNAYKVRVTGFTFSVIRYDKHSAGGRWCRKTPKGENAFPSPAGRLYGFRRQRRHKKWRPKGRPPRQRSDTSYLPRAEHSTRPGGVSRSRTEPLAPRVVRPGGAINPRGEAASTFGNTGKRRIPHKGPSSQMSHTAKKH